MRDTVYESPRNRIGVFVFDDTVARVFPDMIKRSVPGYGEIINTLPVLARMHAQPHTRLYDLGSSLGASTLAMRSGITQPGCRIVAVDNSISMLRESMRLIENNSNVPVDLVCADIRDVRITDASLVVLNFTLQFINPNDDSRLELLRSICRGMNPGGALVLSEKVHFQDSGDQAKVTDLHLAFKKFQGYSDLEIHQKRTALENVLITDTIEEHLIRLRHAGFSYAVMWFQCLNFCSFLAVK